jgi:hypothetical protein
MKVMKLKLELLKIIKRIMDKKIVKNVILRRKEIFKLLMN